MRARLTRVVIMRNHVGAQERATIGNVGVGLVMRLRATAGIAGALARDRVGRHLAASRTDAGGEPWTGFQQGYGIEIPTAEDLVQPVALGKVLAAFAERKLINAGQKKAIAACAFLIAVVGIGVEAVGDRNAVVNLTREGARGITLVVCLIDRKRVIGIVIKAIGHAVRSFNLQCLVVGLAVVEGGVKRGPVLVRRSLVNIDTGSGSLVVGGRTGGNLVEIFGNVQAIGMHSHVADTQ